MERPKLTPERAETIIDLLRDNPGVSMTLADIGDATTVPIDELAANLEEFVDHALIVKETTVDGFDAYRFPADYQRGTMDTPF